MRSVDTRRHCCFAALNQRLAAKRASGKSSTAAAGPAAAELGVATAVPATDLGIAAAPATVGAAALASADSEEMPTGDC